MVRVLVKGEVFNAPPPETPHNLDELDESMRQMQAHSSFVQRPEWAEVFEEVVAWLKWAKEVVDGDNPLGG